jgi:thymidylate synthase
VDKTLMIHGIISTVDPNHQLAKQVDIAKNTALIISLYTYEQVKDIDTICKQIENEKLFIVSSSKDLSDDVKKYPNLRGAMKAASQHEWCYIIGDLIDNYLIEFEPVFIQFMETDPGILPSWGSNGLRDCIQWNPRCDERAYLNSLRLPQCQKNNRTGVGTRSVFSPPNLEFSLRNSTLPLLTTKRVAWKTQMLPELLWFISGSTDTKILERQGCNIWRDNTSVDFLRSRGLDYEEGDLGPGYGFQWRHSGASYRGKNVDYTGQGTDQLQNIIDTLRTDPDSRRMVMCAWNANDLDSMALPPCHLLYQVYTHVEDGKRYLSAKVYMRSADSFLGVPFNIASYSILTHIIAHVVGLIPDRLVMTFGDYHVYNTHESAVEKQLSREPRSFPKIFFKRAIEDINDVRGEDIDVVGYYPHSSIPAPMAI